MTEGPRWDSATGEWDGSGGTGATAAAEPAPRSILAIARTAAERDATAPAPVTLFGTNDRVAKILRGAANDIVRDITSRSTWQGLSELHSQWAFMTQPGRYAYELPPDYLRMIPGSEIRGRWPLGLVGPASPQTWAHWIAGFGAVTAPMGWRIKNNALFIEPTPQGAELLVIEYVSRFAVVKPITAADLNTATMPVTAKAPHVFRDGFIAEGAQQDSRPDDTFDYGQAPGYDDARWGEEIEEYLSRLHPMSSVKPLAQIRAEYFTADTDEPALSDTHMLSVGMTARLRRAMGLPYAEHADEFERLLDRYLFDDAGGRRDIRIGADNPEWETVPLGNGQWLLS